MSLGTVEFALDRYKIGYFYLCMQEPVEMSIQFLKRYDEDLSVLERVITGDETCIHRCDPESKSSAMQ